MSDSELFYVGSTRSISCGTKSRRYEYKYVMLAISSIEEHHKAAAAEFHNVI